jgi:hypothetical protein
VTTAKAPAVSVEQSAGGDISLGAEIDGVFVPFATVTGPQVAFLIAKAKANAPAKASDATADKKNAKEESE